MAVWSVWSLARFAGEVPASLGRELGPKVCESGCGGLHLLVDLKDRGPRRTCTRPARGAAPTGSRRAQTLRRGGGEPLPPLVVLEIQHAVDRRARLFKA